MTRETEDQLVPLDPLGHLVIRARLVPKDLLVSGDPLVQLVRWVLLVTLASLVPLANWERSDPEA